MDGKFKIAFITDLHYGEDATSDSKNDQVQMTLLKAEDPDLVVFGGDMVSGWMGASKKGWLKAHWRRLTTPVRSLGIPYAITLGNHDGESFMSRRGVLAADKQLGQGLSLTRHGPKNITGAANYYLDIYPFASTAQPAARLWFFDSMAKGCEGVKRSWGCVGADTVAWATSLAKRLPPVPTAVAFVHIPLPEIIEVWKSPSTKGRRGEESACPLVNTGLFRALQGAEVGAIWSGHDHNIDYFGVFQGVLMGYG